MRKFLLPFVSALFAALSACGGGSSGPGLPSIPAPAGLTYSQASVVYALGMAISANTPNSSGGWITQYSVEPTLPDGLSLDPRTGVISGLPTAVSAPASYTITGSNSAGSITARVQIEVAAQTLAPESLEYSQASVIYTVDVPTGPNIPSSTGGAIEQYSIEPFLPEGLSLDEESGVISGTPSAVSAPASYIVTGRNSAGSVSAQVMIEVQSQIVAPASLLYSHSAPIYQVGETIAQNVPQSTGGEITQYSVTPALPKGLSLNGESGVISGTPSVASTLTSYIITGSNSAGSVTAQITIEVQSQITAPVSLQYAHPAPVYLVGEPIVANVPQSTGGEIMRYSVSPALPAGLSLNTQTGVISGTPATVSNPASYTVTGSNSAGGVTAQLTIEVQAEVTAPISLQYTQTAPVYMVGKAITSNLPRVTGGEIAQYSVAPALPAGLSLNTQTGIISGTPSAVSAPVDYTITGSNRAGSVIARIVIEVQSQVIAPASLRYDEARPVYTVGQPIVPNAPQSTGGQIAQYSVSPALPAGLSLNALSGVISGTPSAVSASKSYTVTGSNSAGSVSAQITIEIRSQVVAPASLRYAEATPVYLVGQPIAPNAPQSTGGAITQYSVSPALPAGLNLNAQSGVISGAPSAASTLAVYTITGSNSAGSVTAKITIAVQSQVMVPASLRYAEATAVYLVDRLIAPNAPQSTGGAITQYSVAPSLPAGLHLNTQSGVISGTPSAVSASKSYTVTGSNSAGSVTVQLTIEVRTSPVAPPGSLQYTSADVMYDYQQAIDPNLPQATGGVITQYSVSPALPAGLSLHATTGIISGTPSVVSSPVSYTITGSNSAGSVTAQVKIAVKRTLVGEWRGAGTMNVPLRFRHTATRLLDGRVLVAGGGFGDRSSAELYQPADDSWTPAAPMNVRREDHTATLLLDGRVLVAGGTDSGPPHDSAELYDPKTDTWAYAGKMNLPRSHHSATLLSDGRVLVMGGFERATTASADVYDPATDTWKSTGPMTGPRFTHSATLLPDGRVLVAGGVGSGSKVELYDPAENSFAAIRGMNASRSSHSATSLFDGAVLIAGGYDSGSSQFSVELYSPAGNRWKPVGGMKSARAAHTATLLSDGTVLVVGGRGGSSGVGTILKTAERYDSATNPTNPWTTMPPLGTARVGHTATLLLDGTVLVTGGSTGTSEIAPAERLH